MELLQGRVSGISKLLSTNKGAVPIGQFLATLALPLLPRARGPSPPHSCPTPGHSKTERTHSDSSAPHYTGLDNTDLRNDDITVAL